MVVQMYVGLMDKRDKAAQLANINQIHIMTGLVILLYSGGTKLYVLFCRKE